ncbi:hypothetical protein MJD09_09550 [bacterium]|nr:hypothetical protein [bacterium]
MDIKSLSSSDTPKKIDRSANERNQSRNIKKNSSAPVEHRLSSDHMQISQEARALQRREDELKVSKELNHLPSTRANVIYEALAKLKAGHYSSEKIVSEASAKLIASGELDDILLA